MYSIFDELMKARGVTMYRVAKETGISQATLIDWKNGKYTPKIDKMQRMADFFGVTLDYLLGGEQKEKPSSSDKDFSDSDIKFALFGDNDEITDEMYEDVKRYAQYIAERKKQKG